MRAFSGLNIVGRLLLPRVYLRKQRHQLLEELALAARLGVSWSGLPDALLGFRASPRAWLLELKVLVPLGAIWVAAPRWVAVVVTIAWTAMLLRYILLARHHAALSRLRAAIHGDLEAGVPLSQALARHPDVFDLVDVRSLRAGEDFGRPREALVALHQQSRLRQGLVAGIRVALTYPAGVFAVMSVVCSVVLWKVMPTFGEIRAGAEMPPLSVWAQIALELPQMAMKMLPLLVLLLALLVALWRSSLGHVVDAAMLRLPLIGSLLARISHVALLRTAFGTIAAGGRPDRALAMASETLPSLVYRARASRAAAAIERGATLNEILPASGLLASFPLWLLTATPLARMNEVLGVLIAAEESALRIERHRLMTLLGTGGLIALGLFAAAMVSAVYGTLSGINQVPI